MIRNKSKNIKLLKYFYVGIILLLMTACSFSSNVVGKWEDNNELIEFKKDGTFLSSYYWAGGNYAVDNKRLILSTEMTGKEEFVYEINNNILYLYDGDTLAYEFTRLGSNKTTAVNADKPTNKVEEKKNYSKEDDTIVRETDEAQSQISETESSITNLPAQTSEVTDSVSTPIPQNQTSDLLTNLDNKITGKWHYGNSYYSDFIEFNNDGTFFMPSEDDSGTYVVDESRLIITSLSGDESITCDIEFINDVINIYNDGEKIFTLRKWPAQVSILNFDIPDNYKVISISPNGAYILLADLDKRELRILDTNKNSIGKPLLVEEDDKFDIQFIGEHECIAWSPNGQYIAFNSPPNGMRLLLSSEIFLLDIKNNKFTNISNYDVVRNDSPHETDHNPIFANDNELFFARYTYAGSDALMKYDIKNDRVTKEYVFDKRNTIYGTVAKKGNIYFCLDNLTSNDTEPISICKYSNGRIEKIFADNNIIPLLIDVSSDECKVIYNYIIRGNVGNRFFGLYDNVSKSSIVLNDTTNEEFIRTYSIQNAKFTNDGTAVIATSLNAIILIKDLKHSTNLEEYFKIYDLHETSDAGEVFYESFGRLPNGLNLSDGLKITDNNIIQISTEYDSLFFRLDYE